MKKLIIVSGVFLATANISLNAQTYTKQLNNTGWHSIGVPINDIKISSTMFPASVKYVWKWDSVSQSWEFFSNNQILIDSAKGTGIKILSKLEKGDSIWVKTTSASDSIKFENNITTEYLSQDPSDYDTSILKIGSSGQILADDETLYKAIYMKETGLWVEHKTPVTGSQIFTGNDKAVEYCNNLNLAGKSDWYLPTSNDISSLSSIVKDENSSIDNMNLYSFYFVSDSNYGVYEFYNNTYYSSGNSGKYAICFRDANDKTTNDNSNNVESSSEIVVSSLETSFTKSFNIEETVNEEYKIVNKILDIVITNINLVNQTNINLNISITSSDKKTVTFSQTNGYVENNKIVFPADTLTLSQNNISSLAEIIGYESSAKIGKLINDDLVFNIETVLNALSQNDTKMENAVKTLDKFLANPGTYTIKIESSLLSHSITGLINVNGGK